MRDQRLLMQALEGLADGELTQECADCGLDLYVTTTALPFIASDQDATSKAPARTTPLMSVVARSFSAHTGRGSYG